MQSPYGKPAWVIAEVCLPLVERGVVKEYLVVVAFLPQVEAGGAPFVTRFACMPRQCRSP